MGKDFKDFENFIKSERVYREFKEECDRRKRKDNFVVHSSLYDKDSLIENNGDYKTLFILRKYHEWLGEG